MILHYAVKFFSLFSPHIFLSTKGIDPNEEGVLDFCPICEEKLPDKKILTFRKHEISKHGKSDKQAMKEFIQRSPIFWLFMIIPIGALVVFSAMTVSDYLDEIDGYTITDECYDRLWDFKATLYENKKIQQSDIENLDFLIGTCNINLISVNPNEPNMIDQWIPAKSIYNHDENYEYWIRNLEESGFREAVPDA